MPQASVNGTMIHYRMDGPATGPVVMFSNSLASDLTMWDAQAAPLAQAGYRVLCYDSRGHGRSAETPGPYTMETLAADALGLMDFLGLRQIHFCGLSLGGMVGQVLGAQQGKRLRSLTLSDTSAYMPQPEIWADRIETASGSGMQALVETMIDRWFTSAGQKRLPEAMANARRMVLHTQVEGYCSCCAAIRDMDLRPGLPAIKTPTLIMVGEQDQGTPVSAAEFMHDRIASSVLKVIPEAAHLPNVEQAAIFNTTLLEFLGINSF